VIAKRDDEFSPRGVAGVHQCCPGTATVDLILADLGGIARGSG